MRVLIIGGTGIISTGIVQQLLARGDNVVLYNRGIRPAQFEGGVETIIGDRKAFGTFEQQIRAAGTFDCVIDMACYLPEEAESALRAFSERTGQYIFCSTVDVYTKPATAYPITEAAEKRPSAEFPYAFNKARCEELLFAAHERGEVKVTSIRPGHTLGEGGDNFLHALGHRNYHIDRLRKGQPIIVHGNGTSFWPTCHRDDVARAFVGAVGNPKAMGRGYHAAGEEWMTWRGYHQGIAKALGAPPPQFVCIPTDVLRRLAPEEAFLCAVNFSFNNLFENADARADLGFRITVPWVETARRAVDWLEANDKLERSEDHPIYDRVIAAWERATSELHL
ncbi:NAD-dependent epimerase/dehydratase family protein [Devosia sp. Naph2]|uniref:NAD-dependent epimerase/dehydratase family protein n=1 Tax=Devosia polycyclovorans TaxID=3345148 RepID=UPI0035CF4B52